MNADSRSQNPWLSIPAADYEAHMSNPQVGQLQYLSVSFRSALDRHRPTSIACLGCTTGNGFEHLVEFPLQRVVAIDVNAQYLEILRSRYAERVRGLETVCADLTECELDEGAFDLVWGGLVLEYVDCDVVVEKIARWLGNHGVLSVVLQLPSPGRGHVTGTPITSVRVLEPFMKLVEPGVLDRLADRHGLEGTMRRTRVVAGKEFFEADYRKR
jgi:SAM-dependent methyltransferase